VRGGGKAYFFQNEEMAYWEKESFGQRENKIIRQDTKY
jgi:hypothetical protein